MTTHDKRRYELGWLDVNNQVNRYAAECGEVTTRKATAEEMAKYKYLLQRKMKFSKKGENRYD